MSLLGDITSVSLSNYISNDAIGCLRLLIVFSCPSNASPLRLQHEERAIKDSLEHGRFRNRIKVRVLPACTIDDFSRELLASAYDIIHFSGHVDRIGLLTKQIQDLIFKQNSQLDINCLRNPAARKHIEQSAEQVIEKYEKILAKRATTSASVEPEIIKSCNLLTNLLIADAFCEDQLNVRLILSDLIGTNHTPAKISFQHTFTEKDLVELGVGSLAFEGADSKATFVHPIAFARLLSDHTSLQCVVMNACSSRIQGEQLCAHVPLAICFTGRISDQESLAFSKGFYDSVAEGRDWKGAYEQGVRRIELHALEPGMPKRAASDYKDLVHYLNNSSMILARQSVSNTRWVGQTSVSVSSVNNQGTAAGLTIADNTLQVCDEIIDTGDSIIKMSSSSSLSPSASQEISSNHLLQQQQHHQLLKLEHENHRLNEYIKMGVQLMYQRDQQIAQLEHRLENVSNNSQYQVLEVLADGDHANIKKSKNKSSLLLLEAAKEKNKFSYIIPTLIRMGSQSSLSSNNSSASDNSHSTSSNNKLVTPNKTKKSPSKGVRAVQSSSSSSSSAVQIAFGYRAKSSQSELTAPHRLKLTTSQQYQKALLQQQRQHQQAQAQAGAQSHADNDSDSLTSALPCCSTSATPSASLSLSKSPSSVADIVDIDLTVQQLSQSASECHDRLATTAAVIADLPPSLSSSHSHTVAVSASLSETSVSVSVEPADWQCRGAGVVKMMKLTDTPEQAPAQAMSATTQSPVMSLHMPDTKHTVPGRSSTQGTRKSVSHLPHYCAPRGKLPVSPTSTLHHHGNHNQTETTSQGPVQAQSSSSSSSAGLRQFVREQRAKCVQQKPSSCFASAVPRMSEKSTTAPN